MAISQISICNSALSKLGVDRITSITESNKRARVCNEQYSKLKEEVLSAHPWNFALKRASLSQTANTPAFEYSYEYQLPTDCLRVIRAHEDYIEWVREGDKLLTDESTLKIQYISNVEYESDFTATFAEALALRMAADLAYNLVQNADLANLNTQLYTAFLADARGRDSQEGTPRPIVDETFVISRA